MVDSRVWEATGTAERFAALELESSRVTQTNLEIASSTRFFRSRLGCRDYRVAQIQGSKL